MSSNHDQTSQQTYHPRSMRNVKDGMPEIWIRVKSIMGGKVDKVKGKGLSTNDYTAEDKEKVDALSSINTKEIDTLFWKRGG